MRSGWLVLFALSLAWISGAAALGAAPAEQAIALPPEVWIAGDAVPFEIRQEGSEQAGQPRWRIWARAMASTECRELALCDGKVQMPRDMAGIYQIRVTAETRPSWQVFAGECLVQKVVEIRRKDARGSIAVKTPQSRIHYARGEAIPFAVIVRRGEKTAIPITVRLLCHEHTLAEAQVNVEGSQTITYTLPPALTAALAPGDYEIAAIGADLTSVSQQLRIGPALRDRPFRMIAYGEQGPTYPAATWWDAPEKIASHTQRIRRLGFNLLVDRLGDPLQATALGWPGNDRDMTRTLAACLAGDPLAMPPEKVEQSPPLLQVLAACGGSGIQQMAILRAQGAGLPLANGPDGRKADEMTDTIARLTEIMRPYPAFRGWTWANDWRVYGQAAMAPEEKALYDAALTKARETGAWDPILDRVAQHRLSLAPETQDLFNKALRNVASHLITAGGVSFGSVDTYPPISLANVDEVDLQAPGAGLAVPYHALYNVDFYKRPGKRAWGHAAARSESGTGEQIIPVLFQMAMRGADGVGTSGLPSWQAGDEDPRLARIGTASIFRAANGLYRQYGPWLTTLQNADRVAIVASRRMFLIDQWNGAMGLHFARLFEAYISCLHAHRPASILFSDDIQRDTLAGYKAVLVVDQRVEPEPALVDALKVARDAGVAIFHDGTTRESLVAGSRRLETSFDKLEKDPAPAGDDHAFVRLRDYARANLPALRAALANVAPVAGTESDEVLLSERKAEQGRYLFVANNTVPDVDPAHLWRISRYAATRLPMRASLNVGGNPPAIYDLFALSQVKAVGGVVPADLRTLPVRIFAILPAPIHQVALRGPASITAGQPFAWSATVQDAAGKPIAASIPLRVRLLAADGSVLEQQHLAASATGAAGRLQVAINAPAGLLTLEVTELCSGKVSALSFPITPATLPLKLAGKGGVNWSVPATQPATAAGKPVACCPAGVEKSFGPHIREMVLTASGSLAVMNTANWDNNLYAVDVATGHVRWRQRFGDYFAFALRPLNQGFVVQGFDVHSPEGYCLYAADANGHATRRFVLYGLSGCLPQQAAAPVPVEPSNSFAAARDGSWAACAGNLGLAVWSRDGNLQWKQDWWKEHRHPATLAALDPATLLVVEGMRATAYRAMTGQPLWQVTLASSGEVRQVRVAANSRTCAILASTEGGRLFVLRDGKLLGVFPAAGEEIGISADGSQVVVVHAHQLRLYSLADGLQWVFPAADALHNPAICPDGKRIAASSDLGIVYVLDADGNVVHERDMGALAVPMWLADGDLMLGTWMGTLVRLGGDYRPRWQTVLNPEIKDMRLRLFDEDKMPCSRIAPWGNAEGEPAGLEPNLLTDARARVSFLFPGDKDPVAQVGRDLQQLTDGKADPPPSAWLPWSLVGRLAAAPSAGYILLDASSARMRVTGITLFEDPAHPESWLRDAALEYWEASRQQWLHAGPLLSDVPVHTHKLAHPVVSSRYRITLPAGLAGNLRLAEIVLHGELLPDEPPAP